MKKLVLIILGILALMVSPTRSVQAEGIINFSLDRDRANTAIAKAPPGVATQPNPSPKPAARQPVEPVPTRSPAISLAPPTHQPEETPLREVIQRNTPLPERDRLVSLSSDELFEGGSNSLVAKAVGSAEGTRTPDGAKTWAYYGHVDPGNGVWNMGSFSYQHGAASPEDADVRQLNRLRRQFEVILQTASANGLRLGLEEQLNGIDLANQAPLAALDRGGYVDRLRQAYAEGFRGSEAVLRARTYAFINPNTNRWDAPGLGNTEDSISRDQQRRLSAIADAIVAHQQKTMVEPPVRVSRLSSQRPTSVMSQRN